MIMKNSVLFAMMLLFAGLFVACGGPENKKAETTGEQQEIMVEKESGEVMSVDVLGSKIEWEGSKPGGKHYGEVNIKEGTVTLEQGVLKAGEFVMDMQSIRNIDLTDEDMNAKLVGHLKSPDFFNTEAFPESRFVITAVDLAMDTVMITSSMGEMMANFVISGNLTIKGITKNITFPVNIHQHDGHFMAVSAPFNIDRAEWDVQYGSRKFFDNLKDKFIHDEIGLKLTITATP